MEILQLITYYDILFSPEIYGISAIISRAKLNNITEHDGILLSQYYNTNEPSISGSHLKKRLVFYF
jgi:hypothetical protein